MDPETISTLKIVCAAGCAREGFDGDSNSRLEQLADLGLLVVSHAPRLVERRLYKPTEKGWEMYKRIEAEE